MLKPQQHRDVPLVFGKPWYWQRSSGVMESTRSLAHVVMEMREEINKLEAENEELRGDYSQRSHWASVGQTGASTAVMEENPYVNLRRNVSAPVLEGPYKESSAMTVRRYSIGSSLSALTMREGKVDRLRRSDSGWGRLQEELQHGNSMFGNASRVEVAKANNRHSLQDYVHKNRAKVKTVTFLLPVDDIYTNRPVLPKHQEETRINEAESISETDS